MRKAIKRMSLPVRNAEQAPRKQDEPRSTEELRLSLMRKLMLVVNPWRRCPAPACRRNRRCASETLECQKLPQRKRSPEQEQAALASLQRALARRRAEMKGGQEK